jgi:general secretion pathway protein J
MHYEQLKDGRGFTLLEILVAISIFAALTAMLYPAYVGTFRNIDITESYGSVYRMARVSMDRISDDLSCACIPQKDEDSDTDLAFSRVFLGENSETGDKDTDTLEFISEKHLPFYGDGSAGRGRIKYYVKQFDDEKGLTLFRSDNPELGNKPDDEETQGIMLCKDVDSINLSYLDGDGNEYDYWDSSSEPFKGKLPSMIKVDLVFLNKDDPDSPIKFSTSIAIPLAKREYGSSS